MSGHILSDMESILEKYRQHFSDIPALYDYQYDVINKLDLNKNTLAIIPTGGGKSLIYQLMALELEGVTLVISPLLALMEEQVNELNKRGINALALNSNYSFDEQREILRNIENNYRLIYVSPERLQNPFFRASLQASRKKISMVVIDEAHCISQWGGSFRPDYGQIQSFIQYLEANGSHPITLCLTATMSPIAREDICREFFIAKEDVIIHDIIRNNLILHFKEVQNEDEKSASLLTFLNEHRPAKTITYLYSQRKCEEYADEFAEYYKTSYYHAGLESEDKEDTYKRFFNSELDILFATTAFGMGINIPDIDCVSHLQIPNSVEEYYQQVGRGWRKKDILKDCQCVLVWSETNFDRRYKEIGREKFTVEFLNEAVMKIIAKPIKAIGEIINVDKMALNNSDYSLPLVIYKLQKHGIINTIGEINGSPLTIEFRKNTDIWQKVVDSAEQGMDSFRYVSKDTGISIQEIMTHLYDQDLSGNIKKIPAMKKDIYFEFLQTSVSLDCAVAIVQEINDEIDFRLKQLLKLKELVLAPDPQAYLIAELS